MYIVTSGDQHWRENFFFEGEFFDSEVYSLVKK